MLCAGIKSGRNGKQGCSVAMIVDDRGTIMRLLVKNIENKSAKTTISVEAHWWSRDLNERSSDTHLFRVVDFKWICDELEDRIPAG